MKSKAGRIYKIFLLTVLSVLLISYASLADDNWERVINLKGQWKFSIGDNKLWADTYYNDKQWESIYVPAKWEDEGFNGYNGHAWYRKSFEGSSLRGKDLSYNLFLGYIDDVDEVYLNGHKIGYSGTFPPRFQTAYNAFRNYPIPNEYINFNGWNVIAVRVYDSELEGGIVSGDIGIYTNRDDQNLSVNLRGLWDFKVTGRHNYRYTDFDDQTINNLSVSNKAGEWTEINVPDLWEHQGFKNYDGSAWYRKKFIIPRDMAEEDVVLLLGKIDDSDKTYLNGKLIGSTFNQYDKPRIYHIRADQFKAGELNTLLIYVDDPQGYGGIYSGSVGIMKQADFTRYIRWK